MNRELLPGVLVPRSWKESVMAQYLKDWTLPGGWPWKASFQHRSMSVPGDLLILWGTVTGIYAKGNMGFVELETGIVDPYGTDCMPGTATVVLPLRAGPPIRYPFVLPGD